MRSPDILVRQIALFGQNGKGFRVIVITVLS